MTVLQKALILGKPMKNFKRIIALLVSVLIIAVTPFTAMADTTLSDNSFEFVKTGNGNGRITACYLTDENITIPEFVLGYPIAGIGDYAFLKLLTMKTVTMPLSIVSIGEYAFAENPQLVSVRISKYCDSIASNAFANSPNVTILGYDDSYAKTYADEHNIPFESVNVKPTTQPTTAPPTTTAPTTTAPPATTEPVTTTAATEPTATTQPTTTTAPTEPTQPATTTAATEPATTKATESAATTQPATTTAPTEPSTHVHTYEPTWNWSGNYRSATATFHCKNCNSAASEPQNADVVSSYSAGKNIFTATVSFGGQVYTETQRIDLTTINYKYNSYNESTGKNVEKAINKTVDPGAYTERQLIELNMPYIKSAYYNYSGYTYEESGNAINVSVRNTDKTYTVTLDGDEIGEYSYMQTATLNTNEEKAFVIDGMVVYIGTSYSFYVGCDTDITTDDPTAAMAEYSFIDLNSVTVTDDRVDLDMLATANVGSGDFTRMGVAFALSEKSASAIKESVQAITSGSGTDKNNKIYVHNSSVNMRQQSGQYQFRYVPYFSMNKAKDATIYFYTYVVTDDGKVIVSTAAEYDMRNLFA